MNRWLREPLLHFFAAGALLFAVSIYFSPPEETAMSREIVVTDDTRAFLRARFERVWQRQPTAQEEQNAVDEWVREEILFREGMQLGLAESDPLARRRIGQKLMMLADAMAPPPADDAVLRAWYEARADNYVEPQVFTLEQRFFADGRGDSSAQSRARAALTAINSGEPAPSGDATLLPRTLDAAPASYVAASFGAEFADALATLPLGSWQGPVGSAFGAHLVLLKERSGGEQPDFAQVRDEVERDWLYEQGNAARERFYSELRASYEVRDTSGSAESPAS